MSNVERIAEVLRDHRRIGSFKLCLCGHSGDHPLHVAEQLAASGIGHVPTALHQAADDYERAMDDDEMFTSTWTWLHARADLAGGSDE